MYNGVWKNYNDGYESNTYFIKPEGEDKMIVLPTARDNRTVAREAKTESPLSYCAKCEDGSYLITNQGCNANIDIGQSIKVSYIFRTQYEVVEPEHILVLYDNMGEVIDPLKSCFEYLRIGYNPGDCDDAVTQNVTLLEGGEEGCSIEWSSSDKQIIDLNGKVNRPSSGPKSVQLTAKLTYEGRTLVKEFTLTVMNTRNFDPSNVKDLSVDDLAEMNNGYDNYNIEINKFGYITDISGKYSDIKVDSYETALYSLYSLKTAMGISNPFEELKPVSVNADETGNIYKFNQVYNGIEVYSNTVVVSVDSQGNTDYLSSDYFPINKSIDVTPKTTYEEALKSIEEKYIGAEAYGVEQEKDRLYISNYYGETELVWKVYFDLLEDNGDLNKGEYRALVSAVNGDIIYKTCTLQYDSSQDASGIDLNDKRRSFKVTQHKHKQDFIDYTLEDEGRNIFICDAHGAEIFENDIYKSSSKNGWTAEQVSAMANMKDIYDYYKNTFGRISYDDAWIQDSGNNINVYLNTDIKDNAYWQGDKSFFSQNKRYIALGYKEINENVKRSYAASGDVMCHEFTHAVVDNDTELDDIYKGTPGAINEAYADILACCYTRDWLHGEEIDGRGSRDIAAPHISRYSAKVGDEYYVDYSNFDNYSEDNGGVHINSTIISHAAYLMNKNGIEFKDIEKLWYKSLKLNYKNHSDFYDVRNNVVKAAEKLGYSKERINIIEKCFDEVNITQENCDEKVLGSKSITGQDGVVSTSLTKGQVRVVLSWGDKPRDLDSHMLCDFSNPSEGHVYYQNKSIDNNGELVCMLDIDDTSGYGPETTTIYKSKSGAYTFYVYNYSNESKLSLSGATVKVYMNGSAYPVYTFNVPDGEGRYWTVFRYNGATRTICPVNDISNDVIRRE